MSAFKVNYFINNVQGDGADTYWRYWSGLTKAGRREMVKYDIDTLVESLSNCDIHKVEILDAVVDKVAKAMISKEYDAHSSDCDISSVCDF